MKRNFVRKNSKRFVIGDGEDEPYMDVSVPNITVSESSNEQGKSTRINEMDHFRLAIRSTLT